MKRKTITLLVVLAVVAVLAVGLSLEPEASYAREVRKSLDEIMQGIDKPGDPMTALSSNPYDYIKGNPDYDTLISLGFEALPALEAELDASGGNGLRDYIACIAIEDITNCDLKQFPGSSWDQAAAFRGKWDEYLRGMPERVKEIMASDKTGAEKAAEIQQLGAPAIPYMLDSAKSADSATQGELVRAARAAFGDSSSKGSLGEFARDHAGQVQSMRRFVEDR